MSLLVIAWKTFNQYPLVLIANHTDEYQQPREALQTWPVQPAIYGAKALSPTGEAGSWLAIDATGRFAAVTDFHRHLEPRRSESKHPAEFVIEYLRSGHEPEDYLQRSRGVRFGAQPHNLLVGDLQKLFYTNSVSQVVEELSPGTHSLGDSYLDCKMPSCRTIQTQLESYSPEHRFTEADRQVMFKALQNPKRFFDQDLPSRGYALELEQRLSPVFLELGEMGTVSSSWLSLDQQQQVCFEEQAYTPDGDKHAKPHGALSHLEFQLQA